MTTQQQVEEALQRYMPEFIKITGNGRYEVEKAMREFASFAIDTVLPEEKKHNDHRHDTECSGCGAEYAHNACIAEIKENKRVAGL